MLTPAEVASAVVEGVQRNKKGVYIPSNLDWSVRIGKYEHSFFFNSLQCILFYFFDILICSVVFVSLPQIRCGFKSRKGSLV